MGAVYKGLQNTLERPVAIKLLPVDLAADEIFVTRFEREARILAKFFSTRISSVSMSSEIHPRAICSS